MKKSEVLELVASLQDMYPKGGKDFGAKNAQVFCELLLDLDYRTCRAAIRKIAATRTFFPSIAEIRSVYADIAVPTPDADEAWKEALQYGRKIAWGRECNAPKTVVALHPAIEDAIKGLGGWRQLGCSTNQELDRAHFYKVYSTSRERHRQQVISQPLIDTANQKMLRGHDEQED